MMDVDAGAGMGTVGVQALPEEEICRDETGLAEKLRQLCDSFGVELEEKLEDSANVLFNLGKLYLEKALERKGRPMLQKLTYIRCSALLNGAKARFNMKQKTCKVSDVDKILVELNNSLLKSVGITGVGGEEMLEFSMQLLKGIKKMRQNAKVRVAKIPIINDGGNKAKEKKKIEKVRCENLKNTEQYLNLVRKISKKVVEWLGASPCKFAIAGLGSLARQEITLYSDFEWVIVLDDEVQQMNADEYQEIKEYFRWFAVIFQVIMIGFGETMIPSVSIKSLNDHYTSDKSKNWFYDAHTPCGIAFDGMVPHSCNTPLGRQQATEKRKHAIELILPASKMAEFLTHDEEIKNGYYLQNILAGTCFVYGNRMGDEKCEMENDVYKVYLKKVGQKLKPLTEDYILQQKKILDQNYNEAIWDIWHITHHKKKYDIKAEVYRPIITLLGCYGRMKAIPDKCASFDIISRLQGDGIISGDFAHELEHAVAVACEARMKIYALSGSERNAMTMKRFVAFVGKESAINCSQAIAGLKVAVDFSGVHDELDKMVRRSEILIGFGDFKEAIALSKEIIVRCEREAKDRANHRSRGKFLYQILSAKHVMHLCYFKLSENTQPGEYRQRYEELCVDILQYDHRNITRRYMCLYTLCQLYVIQDRSQEFVEMFELLNRYYHGDKFLAKRVLKQNLFLMRLYDFEMRQRITEWDKMLEYLQSERKVEHEMKSLYLLRVHIATVQIRLGQIETGRKELLCVLTEIIENARQIDKSSYVWLLREIGKEQEKHSWTYDRTITFLEEYPLMQGDKTNLQMHLKSEAEKERYESQYKRCCQWRKDNNLPLENCKLEKIWDKCDSISPYLWKTHSDRTAYIQSKEKVLQSAPLNERRWIKFLIEKASESANGGKLTQFHISENMYRDTTTRMYNAAVTAYLHGSFKEAAKIFWNIANDERAHLKIKACEFLMHIIYCSLMRSKLCDVRDFHVKTLPIKGRGRIVNKYNEAANNLFLMKISESAAGLWSILQSCGEKKHYVWRQALALMVFMLQHKVQGFTSEEPDLQKHSSPDSA